MKHILVDDSHSLRAAGMPEGMLWSCSSGLPHLLRADPAVRGGPNVRADQVRSPESLIDAATHDGLGRAVLAARAGIDAALAGQEARDDGFAYLATAQSVQFYAAFLAFAFKGLILATWLAETGDGDRAVIGCPDLSGPRGLGFQLGIHDHVFAAIVREMARGGDGAPDLITVAPVDPKKFWTDFHHVPTFDKAFNILNRRAGAMAYQLWRRCAADTRIGGRRGTILLLSDNEGIEEAFTGLVRRGWRVLRVDTRLAVPATPDPDAPQVPDLVAGLEDAWRAATAALVPPPIAAACWRLLRRRMAPVLAAHPAYLGAAREKVAGWRDRHGDGPGPLVALASGLYTPGERLLDAALREAAIPVVCADHGTAKGLGLRHDYTVADSISFCDLYLAYNAETRALFEDNRRSPAQRIDVIGSPQVLSQTRFPRLQRRLGRMRVGAGSGTAVLFYVTSLMKNNLPQGLGTSTDHVYATFQHTVVGQIGRFPGKVVVKPYPAHRYADCDQIWLMAMPENATVAPFGEFRHIRWAADLLVLDICASTMGWAMGCDVPMIYLDNPHTPLTDRAAAAFREAVFFVDARRPGWEGRLADLLATPLPELTRRWHEMAPARARVSERFVLGRSGGFAGGLVAALDRIGTPAAASRPRGEVSQDAA